LPVSTADLPVHPALADMLRAEHAAPVPEPVRTIADAVRTRHRESVLAVLFYGSCRRDGWSPDALVDLYVLTRDYASVHRSRFARLANRLVPPNVYYAETDTAAGRVRAKYAVVSLDQFRRRMRRRACNPYFWARFAQPVGLVWAADDAVREHVLEACAQAIATAWATARALRPGETDPAVLWPGLFAATYATELRSERPDRAREIYLHDRERYDRIAALLGHPPVPAIAPGAWRRRTIAGKLLSVARLVKAAFTFTGGADYLAWKIERHSGVRIELGPFQRRHPLLAAAVLGFELFRRRAFR